MVVTVEPGFYIVPEILIFPSFDNSSQGNPLGSIEAWWGFGGIRIEDDIRITATTPEVLSAVTPKDPDAILKHIGTA